MQLAVKDRVLTFREEVANSVTHGLGFLASIVAIPVLAIYSVRHGTVAVIAATLFAFTMLLLYLTSTLYHAWPRGPVKRRLQVLDHAAIYLLIAGTYTPFTLGVLRGAWGWTLFGLVWGLALIGIVMKTMRGVRYSAWSLSLYLAMGWLGIIAIKPVLEHVPTPGVVLLAVGGLAYTIGVPFYTAQRLRYSHCVWHLFVLAGSVCHFFAVLWYAV